MMNRTTGRAISVMEHLQQSVADILSTPIGTRVMRRDYGSQVTMLVDQPNNKITELRLMSAAASALMRWEPRLTIAQLRIERDPEVPGRALVRIDGAYLTPAAARAHPLTLSVPTSAASAA